MEQLKRQASCGGPASRPKGNKPVFSASSFRPGLILAAAAAVYFAANITQSAVAQAAPAQAAPLVPAAQAPATPPHAHVMWNGADGTMSLWTVGDDGTWTHKEYGPFPGWTAKMMTDGADGVTNILWTHAPDGQVSLWKLDSAGHPSNTEYGPYPGWSAVALSRFTPGAGGGALTGAAGGDLFGLYPNPTVAANAIDHTKLASDPGSLGQVSGGLLSTNDNWHVNVQNDLIVKGTVVALQGNGGGVGNNNKQGRAIVDDGKNGLAINYANDFGQVVIAGGTTVHGTFGTDGNITSGANIFAAGEIHSGSNIYSALGVVVTGEISTGSNILCGSGLLAKGVIQSGGNISSGLGILAAGDMHANGNITSDNTLTGKTLQITGGSDLAEPYKIAPADNTPPRPGLVVSIDPEQTGQMRVCARAYDNSVGGIISGAGGVQPGVVLRQAGTVADGTLPIASVGRVWCWCDADAGGAITPGDLLTTSATPGHAMRVRDHDRARGAVLGKAMSPLKSGRGLVLVLVTLE